MTPVHHPECYGRLFPNVLRLPEDREAAGKVFTVLLERAGGMFRSTCSARADLGQWDRCQECGDYGGCYDLSMAQLALESAIQGR